MATEFFDIKRKMLISHRSCCYTVTYRTDDNIIGQQKILCLNEIFAIATEDSFDFKYVSRYEFIKWFKRNSSYYNSISYSTFREIDFIKEELEALQNFIVNEQTEIGRFKVILTHCLFDDLILLSCDEYCIPVNQNIIRACDVIEKISKKSPLYRILSKHNTVYIGDEILRETHPVLEDIGYVGKGFNFEFTYPVCKNKNSPAGFLGWPTVFYNNNKEFIKNLYNSEFNKIIINDPNIKDHRLFVDFRDFIPIDLKYSQFVKIWSKFILTYNYYTFRDYCNYCKKLNIAPDLNIKDDKELKIKHDKIMEIYNNYKCSLQEVEYSKIRASYKNLEYDNGCFTIKYPEKLSELIKEGRELHHCVGSYCERVVKGKDIIMFLRKKNELDTPFVTINLIPTRNGLECRQAHGVNNCKISTYPEAEEFLNQWFKKFNIVHTNIDKVC